MLKNNRILSDNTKVFKPEQILEHEAAMCIAIFHPFFLLFFLFNEISVDDLPVRHSQTKGTVQFTRKQIHAGGREMNSLAKVTVNQRHLPLSCCKIELSN